mmetsp:Transcript_117388/g.336750  ORF Transcript_117388/g.336750 Transcript_117388/m.336750 type:complete len:325 (+) Transcript_117388:1443-2417(+)
MGQGTVPHSSSKSSALHFGSSVSPLGSLVRWSLPPPQDVEHSVVCHSVQAQSWSHSLTSQRCSSRASPMQGKPPYKGRVWFRTLAVICSMPQGASQVLQGDQSFHSQSTGHGPWLGHCSTLTTLASQVSFPWPYVIKSRCLERFAMPHEGHSPIHSDQSVYLHGSGHASKLHGPSSERPDSHLAPKPAACTSTTRILLCRPPPHEAVHSVHGVQWPYRQSRPPASMGAVELSAGEPAGEAARATPLASPALVSLSSSSSSESLSSSSSSSSPPSSSSPASTPSSGAAVGEGGGATTMTPLRASSCGLIEPRTSSFGFRPLVPSE